MQTTPDLDEGERSQKFSQHFEFKSVLGNGAFGLVVAATDRRTGELVAVKVKPFRFSDFLFLLDKHLFFTTSWTSY
mgnify:CR=1 FL=1